MRLYFVCAENVQNFYPARFEVIRNQRAMAAPPDCFCAHDSSRAGFPGNIEKALDSFLELLDLHAVTIERVDAHAIEGGGI